MWRLLLFDSHLLTPVVFARLLLQSCMRATQKRKRPAVQRQSAAQLYTVAQDKRMRDDASVTSTQEQYTYAEHTQFASASEQQPPAAAAPSSGFFSGGAYAQDLGAGSGTDESGSSCSSPRSQVAFRMNG